MFAPSDDTAAFPDAVPRRPENHSNRLLANPKRKRDSNEAMVVAFCPSYRMHQAVNRAAQRIAPYCLRVYFRNGHVPSPPVHPNSWCPIVVAVDWNSDGLNHFSSATLSCGHRSTMSFVRHLAMGAVNTVWLESLFVAWMCPVLRPFHTVGRLVVVVAAEAAGSALPAARPISVRNYSFCSRSIGCLARCGNLIRVGPDHCRCSDPEMLPAPLTS